MLVPADLDLLRKQIWCADESICAKEHHPHRTCSAYVFWTVTGGGEDVEVLLCLLFGVIISGLLFHCSTNLFIRSWWVAPRQSDDFWSMILFSKWLFFFFQTWHNWIVLQICAMWTMDVDWVNDFTWLFLWCWVIIQPGASMVQMEEFKGYSESGLILDEAFQGWEKHIVFGFHWWSTV